MVRRSTLILITCAAALWAGPSPYLKGQVAIAQTPPALVAQTSSDAELYIGSRGIAVRTLQTQLRKRGLYDGPLDGIFGLSTQKAVLAFQSESDIKPTGRLGKTTRQALQLALTAGSATESDSAAASQFDTSESSASTSDISDTASDTAIGEIPDKDQNNQAKKGTRIVKLLIIGLGLFAVVGSFGIGFLVASRGKQDAVNPSSARANHVVAGSLVASPDPDSRQPDQVSNVRSLDPNEMIGGLIQSLHTAGPQHRRKLIWELGQRGHSPAVQPLVDLMAQTDSKEKSLILAALSEMSVRSMRPLSQALAIALQDDNPEVRKNAIRDLSRIHDLVAQASHLLCRAVEDDDSDVRQTAKWALEQLGRIRQPHNFETGIPALPDGSAISIDANTMEFEASEANGSRLRLQS